MVTPNLLEEIIDLQKAEYFESKKDLGLYVQSAWDTLEPETELKWNWHHDYICEHLQAAADGQIRRLIINVAPRSTKSILATVGFPTWIWILDPATRFLFGSHSASLATKHSMLRRNLIESAWYQKGYSKRFKLKEDINTKAEFANDKTGQMKSAGILSSVIGEGGDYIIIDDPHDPMSAASESERENTITNFDLAWSSRLNDKKTGRIIVIMQRLHEKDLTGHLLAKDMGYVHIKIPSIAEERERIVFPLTRRELIREAGDYMHPERDGEVELNQAKLDLGPYGFSGQHQQSPVPSSGGLFTADMFDFIDPPSDLQYRFITADTAYNEKKENDFTVFTAFGVKNEEIYVLDVFRKQIKASDVEVPAIAFIQRFMGYGFRGTYIEPKGHGIYLNQHLPSKGVMIPSESQIKEFYTDRKLNKVERANNAIPYLGNRRIHINPLIAQKEALLTEILGFPRAAHDDFVDCVIDSIKFVYARKVGILDVL